jgi:hypothetical protein
MSLPCSQALREALVPFYRDFANSFPFLVPVYRNIAHRELHPPFRRKFAVGELHEAIKRESGIDVVEYSSRLEQMMASCSRIRPILNATAAGEVCWWKPCPTNLWNVCATVQPALSNTAR